MRRLLILVLLISSFQLSAQSASELTNHYEAYYKQMKTQGDVQGIISALTHLNILEPSEARKDTLAYIYMSEGKHLQALNTIGIERQVDDSDIAVEVKAVSLKAAKQPKLAIEHFDEMFKRLPNALVAYELAELNLQTENFAAATIHADYGIANSKDDMVKAFYETQTPYQVPLKASFLYIKGLIKFNENTTANIDAAVDILDEALKSAPNFNMAQVAKNALLQQKQQQAQVAEPTKE